MPYRERLVIPSSKQIFVTTAQDKKDIAYKLGYDLLPQELSFLAEEAGRWEDRLTNHLHVRVVDNHYRTYKSVAGTVQAAANKKEGVDTAYEHYRNKNPGKAMDFLGRNYSVMDCQMVVVAPESVKMALKKPRGDSLQHIQEDVGMLLEMMKRGSEYGSTIEYLSTFAEGVFGNPMHRKYRSVRANMGRIRRDFDINLMASLMTINLRITGGIDVLDLVSNFLDCQSVDVKIKTYTEANRHYEGDGNVVIVDKLIETSGKRIVLPREYSQNPIILSNIARGFAQCII